MSQCLVALVGASAMCGDATPGESVDTDAALAARLENARIIAGETPKIEVDFVLENISKKSIVLSDRWNSWGAYQWSFRITDANGQVFSLGNPQMIWYANTLTTFTIPPGGEKRTRCRLVPSGHASRDRAHENFTGTSGPWSLPSQELSPPCSSLKLKPVAWTYPVEIEGIFTARIHRPTGTAARETNWAGTVITPKASLAPTSP